MYNHYSLCRLILLADISVTATTSILHSLYRSTSIDWHPN